MGRGLRSWKAKQERKLVPKRLRQYAKRYANKSPGDVLAMQRRF
jgi:hypothetical protein